MIRTKDIRHAIEQDEIIENCQENARGHSCLILVIISSRPIHIVCSPKTDYLSVITAYIPNERDWENNYKKRKKP